MLSIYIRYLNLACLKFTKGFPSGSFSEFSFIRRELERTYHIMKTASLGRSTNKTKSSPVLGII